MGRQTWQKLITGITFSAILIERAFIHIHGCNNCNLYKREGIVQKYAKGHHFERSYHPNNNNNKMGRIVPGEESDLHSAHTHAHTVHTCTQTEDLLTASHINTCMQHVWLMCGCFHDTSTSFANEFNRMLVRVRGLRVLI